jgi:hypothetical protein
VKVTHRARFCQWALFRVRSIRACQSIGGADTEADETDEE